MQSDFTSLLFILLLLLLLFVFISNACKSKRFLVASDGFIRFPFPWVGGVVVLKLYVLLALSYSSYFVVGWRIIMM